MITKTVIALVGFSFAATALACSSGDATPDPVGKTKTGITECGGVSCQAGSHCEDERIDDCESGCTTDNNCPDDQKCVNHTCDNGTAQQEPIGCFRMNAYDEECVIRQLPKNAYACNQTNPPSNACVPFPDQQHYPGGYCCP